MAKRKVFVFDKNSLVKRDRVSFCFLRFTWIAVDDLKVNTFILAEFMEYFIKLKAVLWYVTVQYHYFFRAHRACFGCEVYELLQSAKLLGSFYVW